MFPLVEVLRFILKIRQLVLGHIPNFVITYNICVPFLVLGFLLHHRQLIIFTTYLVMVLIFLKHNGSFFLM